MPYDGLVWSPGFQLSWRDQVAFAHMLFCGYHGMPEAGKFIKNKSTLLSWEDQHRTVYLQQGTLCYVVSRWKENAMQGKATGSQPP